ncbi:MAG TPA: SRPBCC domain-containing protein [Polyangia bacterium]|nr:SRPBCC domain-containing protein [Polyangia bacterium]
MPEPSDSRMEGAAIARPPELRITRVFDAPRQLVFEAWTKAEYLSRWFTPAPLTTHGCQLDFRPGGVFRLTMRTPDGVEFPMDARFTEIIPDERIVFAATVHGNLKILTTVTFAGTHDKTTLTVHQVYSHESDATRGANAGWTLTLNQLAAYLRG